MRETKMSNTSLDIKPTGHADESSSTNDGLPPPSTGVSYDMLANEMALLPCEDVDAVVQAPATTSEVFTRLHWAETSVSAVFRSTKNFVTIRQRNDQSCTVTLTPDGRHLATVLKNFPFELVEGHVLSVGLEILKSVISNLGGFAAFDALPSSHSYHQADLDQVNFNPRCRPGFIRRVVTDLQEAGKTPQFRRDMKASEQRSQLILDRLVSVVQNLFEAYANLLVVRVDFGYKATAKGTVDTTSAKEDLRKFFNGLRHRRMFNHLAGYIWKSEQGVLGGVHFHLIFFFNEAHVQQDIVYSLALGQFWGEVTKGRGIFHSCNARKHTYRFLGIGKISHNDVGKHEVLHRILQYFAKSEQAICTPRLRTFGHSKPHAPKPNNLGGRPREGVLPSVFVRPMPKQLVEERGYE